MARLKDAQLRLDKALSQLEQAAASETGELHKDLAAARGRSTQLEDRNRSAALRLDAAIERVREILNG